MGFTGGFGSEVPVQNGQKEEDRAPSFSYGDMFGMDVVGESGRKLKPSEV